MATEDLNTDTSTEQGSEYSSESTSEHTIQESQGTGLDSNVAGALAYLFGALTGIVFYVLEPEDEFVRFHASQSIVVSVGFFVLAFATSILTTVLGLLGGASAGASVAFGLVSLYVGLSLGSTAVVSTVGALYFVVAAAIGVVVLDEPLSATRVAGIGLAVVSIVLISR